MSHIDIELLIRFLYDSFYIAESISEFDLLSSVVLSEIDSGGVTYVEGTDGFPAFAIGNANLRRPHKSILPEKLEEFTIMATLRATKPDGYIFAVVNSLDTIVQLGIKISPAHHNHINITLIYNDPFTLVPQENNGLVSFVIPYDSKNWLNFAIQVMNDKIALYHNCIKVQEVNVTKEPRELIFESASTFYLAQAGSIIKGKFEVSFKITKETLCHCQFFFCFREKKNIFLQIIRRKNICFRFFLPRTRSLHQEIQF